MDDEAQNPPSGETPAAGAAEPLTYEETPVVESPPPPKPPASLPLPATPPSPPASPPPAKGKQILTVVGSLVVFAVLFAAGMWLSTVLRQYLTPSTPTRVPSPTPTPTLRLLPSPTLESRPTATPSAIIPTGWQTFEVTSGATKQPIGGLSYKLPPEALPPTCDSANCSSQGTYLPGGTRFTVAPRGKGQLLPDFRGGILTDANGREFTMRQITLAGQTAYNFSADFAGKTGGGYSFSQMRGVLIPITDTLSLEFNHFAPSGITSDFATDEALFEQIVATLVIPASEK